MTEFYTILEKMELFSGIDRADFDSLLSCLGNGTSEYEKGSMVLYGDGRIDQLGIILKGQLQIIQDDFFGNRSIMTQLGPGNLFGESFAFSGLKMNGIYVEAATDCKILFMSTSRFITPCGAACGFHSRLIFNMLTMTSGKNVLLTEKISLLSKRSTRDKVLSYLSISSRKAGSNEVTIPFNRQEFADYLCVERSALSAELSRLKKEGLIDFHKNQFQIL
ncbi:MAG: Crp/Fnr family transcriptional regulator [Lachnospiraceae bacterium]